MACITVRKLLTIILAMNRVYRLCALTVEIVQVNVQVHVHGL